MASDPVRVPQLPLAERKRIAAQIRLFDEIVELGPESAGADDFDWVGERIRRLAADDEAADDPATPLQAYLEAFAARVRTIIEAERIGLGREVWDWLERYFERLSRVPCCVGKEPTCRGHDRGDARAVVLHGFGEAGCVASIREMYDQMADLAHRTYERHVRERAELRFGTRLAARDVELSAVTIIEGGAGRRSTVVLEVQCRGWRIEDYLAIPYVLAHECIVHGYQGWDGEGANVHERDPFAEGWIDSLAFKAFDEHMRDHAGSRRASRVLYAGRVHHDRRYGLERMGRIRTLGREASQYLQLLCVKIFGTAGSHVATDFALQLNAVLANLEIRSAFVYVLADLSHQKGPLPSPRAALLERLLRQYHDGILGPAEIAHRMVAGHLTTDA